MRLVNHFAHQATFEDQRIAACEDERGRQSFDHLLGRGGERGCAALH